MGVLSLVELVVRAMDTWHIHISWAAAGGRAPDCHRRSVSMKEADDMSGLARLGASLCWLDANLAQVFYRQGLTPTQSLKRTWGEFLRTSNLQSARHLQKQMNIARSKDGNLC
jgi:hypothetical protein